MIQRGASGYTIFSQVASRRTQPCYLRNTLAVDTHAAGAYFVGCWGVVQPVGHLTVNEDGGGSNPPAPANSLELG